MLDDVPSECKGSSHTFSPALEPVKTKLADVLVGSTIFAESIEPLRAEMGYAASMASIWFPSAYQSADQVGSRRWRGRTSGRRRRAR